MRVSFAILIVSLILLLSTGCDTNVDTPEVGGFEIAEPLVVKKIILETSDDLVPYHSSGDVYHYDFSNFIAEGFNSFDIQYGTSSSCDIPVFVFNHALNEWELISQPPGPDVGCLAMMDTQYHIFRTKGDSDIRDYLDESNSIEIKGVEGGIRALRLNEHYYSVPLPFPADGLTYDGETLWLSSNFENMIYQMSRAGYVIDSFSSPNSYPFGLAWDGIYLYNTDGSDNIYQITTKGKKLSHFSLDTDFPGGLTFDGENLWMCESAGLDKRILQINLDRAFEDGKVDDSILHSFRSPTGNCRGLAFDGDNILVSSSSGYKVDIHGNVVGEFVLPIHRQKGLAWDGEYLWVIENGPLDGLMEESSSSLSRFYVG